MTRGDGVGQAVGDDAAADVGVGVEVDVVVVVVVEVGVGVDVGVRVGASPRDVADVGDGVGISDVDGAPGMLGHAVGVGVPLIDSLDVGDEGGADVVAGGVAADVGMAVAGAVVVDVAVGVAAPPGTAGAGGPAAAVVPGGTAA